MGRPSAKFKLTGCSDYYPQNIMHDKRVQKGNTYAAMVIPAGAYPDTMQQTSMQDTANQRTMKKTMSKKVTASLLPP